MLLILAGGLLALWLLGHVGPGWPRSMNDATEAELRALITAAAGIFAVALVLFIVGMWK